MSITNSYIYKQKNKNILEKKDTLRSKEALIKINKKIKCFSDFKKNIKYITRNYELPLYSYEGYEIDGEYDFVQYEYEGREEIKKYIEFFNFDGAIPEYLHSRKKERNEVFNFIFSMKGKIDSSIMLEAVEKTIKEKYPDNPACFSCPNDSENTYIYCNLRLQSEVGNRIDFKFKDGYELRESFAKNLNDLDIKAKATRRYKTNKKDEIKDI